MTTSSAGDEKRQFNVLLPASLIREIKLASVDRGVSLSAFVEEAVRSHLGKEMR
jgi:predicted HicB family RNase H-like nuclease